MINCTAVSLGVHVDVVRVHAEGALGDQQVGQHQAGALVVVGQVEHLRDGVEGVEGVQRRHDEPGEIALAGAQQLPEVALLRLGGHARGGAGPLHVHQHDGYLHHGGGADGLRHQGEPAAGGGGHGACARVRCADDHVRNADLVLNLPHHDAQVAGVLRHPVQHAGGGAHGVGGVELHARRGPTHRDGIVAGPLRQRVVVLRQRHGVRRKVLLRVVVSDAGHADVLVDHRLPLPREPHPQAVLKDAEVELQQRARSPDGHRVLHQPGCGSRSPATPGWGRAPRPVAGCRG